MVSHYTRGCLLTFPKSPVCAPPPRHHRRPKRDLLRPTRRLRPTGLRPSATAFACRPAVDFACLALPHDVPPHRHLRPTCRLCPTGLRLPTAAFVCFHCLRPPHPPHDVPPHYPSPPTSMTPSARRHVVSAAARVWRGCVSLSWRRWPPPGLLCNNLLDSVQPIAEVLA
ncbi:hypothetical protein GUJ93_ZPchr0007g3106 [Zizania palustris]|uniref:Uncharacterized protein n=1 Tax=Zizania palustris TaxID=103762 RepID=A0A8J5T782_ZIZPA|nr:hypothetical protein GUJ93_ZPchr0007g3106 [Zizania palustris]